MLRRLIFAIAAILPLTAHSAPSSDVVAQFHESLLSMMKQGEALGCAGRIQQLQAVIPNTFDIPFVSRQVLRKRWAGLPPPQQQQFSAALTELIVLSYASNFTRYSGETFTADPPRDPGRGRIEIPTHLKTGDGKLVSLDYFLHPLDGRWRVINIIADGVSDLALRSAQYERGFQDGGFDGLMAKLREQTDKNRAACK